MKIIQQLEDRISKKLDEKRAQEVSQAVMETGSPEGVQAPKLEKQDVSTSETVPLSARSDKLSKSIDRLRVIAERYNFRPFVEAAKSVESDFRNLKSGVDLIS